MQLGGSKIAADNATLEIINGVLREKDAGTTLVKLAAALKERIVKGWIQLNGIGVIVIRDSYNVDTIADIGVGHYRVNWDVDFANVDYACVMARNIVAGSELGNQSVESYAVGSIDLKTTQTTGAAVDCLNIIAIAIGDQ